MHICMNSYIKAKPRDIHTFMHTCMNSYIKAKPLIITSTTDKGESDIHSFIQSGYFYSVSLSPLLLRGAGPSRGGRGRKKFPVLEPSVVLTHGGPPRLRASNKRT